MDKERTERGARGEGDVSWRSEETGRWQVEGRSSLHSVDGGLHGADGRCPKRGVGVFFAWVVAKEGRGGWGSPRGRRVQTQVKWNAQHLSTSAEHFLGKKAILVISGTVV